MVRKISIIFICIMLSFLAGCSVASEKEIVRFTNDRYGKATLIKTEQPSDKETICYFMDDEYGFEYFVTSYMNDIIIDGSKFGSSENKGSNFDVQYYSYINDSIKDELSLIKKKYNIDISLSDGTYIYYFARITYNTENYDNVSYVTKEVSDLYTSVDTRHYWKELVVEAYDINGVYLGSYHHEENKWMTPDEEEDLFYIEHIKNISANAIYLRKEEHKFTDTGVNINDVVQVLGNPEIKIDSIVTYYIFSIDGDEFYICDFMVHDDIGGFEWYTNYKK